MSLSPEEWPGLMPMPACLGLCVTKAPPPRDDSDSPLTYTRTCPPDGDVPGPVFSPNPGPNPLIPPNVDSSDNDDDADGSDESK